MKPTNDVKIKDLVLVGGGHSHAMALKMLGMKPIPGVQITLIARDIDTPYSGMLPGYVEGLYEKDECYIDLNRLCRFADARLLHCSACQLDTVNKLVYCDDGRPPIRYDVLSIDIGITPKTLSKETMMNHDITPVKPIDRFGERWENIIRRLREEQSNGDSTRKYTNETPLRFIVVGGGAGGIELAMAMKQRLQKELHNVAFKFTICTRGETIATYHGRQVKEILSRILHEQEIEVISNACIIDAIRKEGQEQELIALDGRTFPFDFAIWCTQGQSQQWVKDSGLETTEDGFICVKPTLESVNVPNVFASGDVAHFVDNPRPKAGVFAVRAAAPLVENFRNRFLFQPLQPWIPQDEFLGIIGTGNSYGVASKGGMGVEGPEMWKLKEKIDRQWMDGLQTFPDMEKMMAERLKQQGVENDEILSKVSSDSAADTLSLLFKPKMRCGGCGSKIGSQILTRALNQVHTLYPYTRDEVINTTGDDAALLFPPKPSSMCEEPLLVQTIDYIKTLICDPFIMGKIAAMHALSDIFAMNASPVSALALCVIPLADDEIMVDRLQQLLAGIKLALQSEHCALVGGHSSEGSELSVGLSVTGVVNRKSVLPKGPLLVGQKLILTKGLGTGVIIAADMELKARGRWVSGAITSALQSNREAARIFSTAATACTDVTGFGLIGHLLEMLKYNSTQENIGVELYLSGIPILDGAEECVQAGAFSSLLPQNIRSARAIKDSEHLAHSSAVYPILFDPQTSGGLLAAVPSDKVESTIKALHDAGYDRSSVIGELVIKADDEDFDIVVR